MPQQPNYGVVLVTAASREQAVAIAQSLLAAHLAACVNLFPVHSLYTWQGNLETAEEWQLVIKTDLVQFPELERQVRALHSYEVPEIIALPIVAGSPPYLAWIAAQVDSRKPETP
jgi:periplasmic divalent cation tolerance protein